MVGSGKGLGSRIRLGGEGAVEFLEFGFDDLRDCRDNKVIEDSAEDLGLESLKPYSSTPLVHVGVRIAL
jgi:hypothetical protein